jgi:hypothetical protein
MAAGAQNRISRGPRVLRLPQLEIATGVASLAFYATFPPTAVDLKHEILGAFGGPGKGSVRIVRGIGYFPRWLIGSGEEGRCQPGGRLADFTNPRLDRSCRKRVGTAPTSRYTRGHFKRGCFFTGIWSQPSASPHKANGFGHSFCFGEKSDFPRCRARCPSRRKLGSRAYGVSARIISVPGHTAGMIALLTDENEDIAADCFAGHPFSPRKPKRNVSPR